MGDRASGKSDISAPRQWPSVANSGRARLGERLGSAIKVALVPLVATSFLTISALDIGPAWSARLRNGTHGTFTAERCERERTGRCFWTGTFVSDTGRIRRVDVGFASGGRVTRIGQQARVLDTGDRLNVYPIGGGWDWLIVTIVVVLSLAAFSLWILVVPIEALRRRHRLPSAHDRRSV